MTPSTNSAADQRLVLYTRHCSSQLSLLHLPLERFTAYAVKPDTGSESRLLPIPPAFDAPLEWWGVPVGILAITEKLEWLGYPTVKTNLKICLFVFT